MNLWGRSQGFYRSRETQTMSKSRNDSRDRSVEQDNKELVQQHFSAVNERDRDAIAGLHAEDVVVHSGGRELRGLEAVVKSWWAQLDAVPDLTDTIDMLVAEGDTVAVRYTTTGTHEGEFRGIEPTGTELEITSMAVVRIDDGELAEWWNHPDRFGLFRQLGVVEHPGK